MGNCIHCGKSAGFLRTKHPECEERQEQRQREIEEGRDLISEAVSSSIIASGNFSNLEQSIVDIEASHSISENNRRELLVTGWERSVDHFLEDGVLDESEEKRLLHFQDHFSLSQEELDVRGALTKTTKAAVLREILGGQVAERISIKGDLPINLQKSEKLVWAFPGCDYLEDKSRRHYIGRSHGASVRIMKGVYYRIGAFQGHAVERTERVHVDTGLVAATTKHIYFSGSRKSLRIPYSKIVSFQPFSDGIGVMRDAQTAKPQIFVTGDGWFTYNLVSNLAQM